MSKRLRGDQRVDEEDWNNEEKLEAAKKAMSTPLVAACRKALGQVAEQFGVEACDDECCMFPGCLEGGCEGEPVGEQHERFEDTLPSEDPR